MRQRRQRNRRAIRGPNVDTFQGLGALRELGGNFHNNVILIQLAVHDGDLPLSERIVQSAVHVSGAYTQPCRGVTIDDDALLQAFILLVAVYHRQLRNSAEFLKKARRPGVQVLQIFPLQRVLILRLALPATDG